MNDAIYKNGLVIAFGKGRLFTETIENFDFIDNPLSYDFTSAKIPVYNDIERNITYISVRHADLNWMLKNKHIDIAIGSSLWFLNEGESSLIKARTLQTKNYHLDLIAKKNVEINHIRKVATKFENIALSYFKNRGQKVEVIRMNGAHEVALSLGMADAIIDVVETGQTIRKMNLHQLDIIYKLYHEVWLRNDENLERNLAALDVLQRKKHSEIQQVF
jgi:ATP phosphoribosyltransferase